MIASLSLASAACSSPEPSSSTPTSTTPTSAAPTSAGPRPSSSALTVSGTSPKTAIDPTTATRPPAVRRASKRPSEQPGWTAVAKSGANTIVDERSLDEPGGSPVTVFRFRSRHLRFDLHVGGLDPPLNGQAVPADAGYAVSTDERPVLVAAFNGGFQASASAGGFEVDGEVLRTLVPGLASLVIDANGSAHVGVWGQDVPRPGEQVVSVRQNLPPLIEDRRPSSSIDDPSVWGAVLGGGATVARSALGEDARGNLLYAASMSSLPAGLASALRKAGAVNAMELDINPEWVQLALASAPGAALSAGVPGQDRPANQYLDGWSRDFVTALAKP